MFHLIFAVGLNDWSNFRFKAYAICMNSHEQKSKKIIHCVTK